MGKKLDVYFPLIIGDWLKGTRGMKAEVKGVYIGLLLYQWDNNFLPSNLDDLLLIEPEVGKVWVSISSKFKEVEPGKLQNEKVEEVRAFFQKQSKNGQKGGRPKKDNPNQKPKDNPNHNLHNELELDIEFDNDLKGVQGENLEQRLAIALDELYLDGLRTNWAHVDFDFELRAFLDKVRGSPDFYANHDKDGLRLAFQSQLRNAKKKTINDNGFTGNKQNQHTRKLAEAFVKTYGPALTGGPSQGSD